MIPLMVSFTHKWLIIAQSITWITAKCYRRSDTEIIPKTVAIYWNSWVKARIGFQCDTWSGQRKQFQAKLFFFKKIPKYFCYCYHNCYFKKNSNADLRKQILKWISKIYLTDCIQFSCFISLNYPLTYLDFIFLSFPNSENN